MNHIKNLLKSRETYLRKLQTQKEASLESAPEGLLRICRDGNHLYYYHKQNSDNPNGAYLPKSDFLLARQLAQKDYDTKVLRAVSQELQAIKKYLSTCPKNPPETIYELLSEYRQQLVTPIAEPEDQFIKNWTSVEYTGKAFDANTPELCTARGERVRSKSEIIIADLLHHEGIPYRYEYPVYLRGFGTVYPDFTVLNVRLRKEIYWEHMGMMDDPEYVQKALQKLITYEQNGIYPGENLILTFETKQLPINQKLVLQMIHRYLQ